MGWYPGVTGKLHYQEKIVYKFTGKVWYWTPNIFYGKSTWKLFLSAYEKSSPVIYDIKSKGDH